jgi:membrane fusion protein, multidrug efflux system
MTRFIVFIALASFAASCGSSTSKKEREAHLTEKKTELQELKADKAKLDQKIKSLEAEIAKLDTGAGRVMKPKLVKFMSAVPENFSHYIDLQGRVDAENISYISPRGAGGQVRALFVKEGDYVRKGQLVAKLDDAVARQNVVAVKQSIGSVRTQLQLAKSVYQRQKNLWDQNIGTEVQLLQARTNMEALEAQLRTMQANVNLAQEQVNLSNVYSNVSGVVDQVNIHVGETFAPGAPSIKVVNKSDLKAVTEVPENYAGKIKQGTAVEISIPDLGKKYTSKISLISQSISTTTRGFLAEAKLPQDAALKPNMIAHVRILDYSAPGAIVAPVNTLQTDEKGKFILVAVKEKDKLVARKRQVQIGELYGDKIEIKQGIQPGDMVIVEGFQGLYDGVPVTDK